MLSLLWLIVKMIMVIVWFMSTVHVLVWCVDDSCPIPYPLKKVDNEPRFEKWLKIFAYAPTVAVVWVWRKFEATRTGAIIIKWFKEKV